MNRAQKFGVVFVMFVFLSAAVADSLELKNGSLINGRFMGGDQNTINFQVGSSLQTYNVGDVRALRFDSPPEGAGVSLPSAGQQYASVSATEAAKISYMTIPQEQQYRCARSTLLTPPRITWEIDSRLPLNSR